MSVYRVIHSDSDIWRLRHHSMLEHSRHATTSSLE